MDISLTERVAIDFAMHILINFQIFHIIPVIDLHAIKKSDNLEKMKSID